MTVNTPNLDSAETTLTVLSPATRRWFVQAFAAPTAAQRGAWPAVASGQHTLLLAPTGSGKTLAAFLIALDALMFGPAPTTAGTRLLYISPLKALGVDIERNLRAPLAGLAASATALGLPYRLPRVGVRTGDTSATERRQFQRDPPEILITTPESLYLILTSQARASLGSVERVIIDEIHALAGIKRGVHLALSLERLEALRQSLGVSQPVQRIGLSATQRPLEEIARFLGGYASTPEDEAALVARPVCIVDAGRQRALDIRIDVPAEDLRRSDQADALQPGATSAPAVRPSVWPAIHPRLLALIQAHRCTLIFVNSRRLAERIAAAINELAGSEQVAAHHGSLARLSRLVIEDRLKRGELAGLVATSSLELGIDMGAVDLVVQIEAPPTLAQGLQRIGRAGHRVDATSKGVLIPKYRADVLACAAAREAMLAGEVEATRYPRNALDVLAQQIVATVAVDPIAVEQLWALVRRAAPYAELPRSAFEGVLDLLAGRYPTDAFAELKPRITWDRANGGLTARQGAGRVAIVNAGTIPDRGLYGVYLAGAEGEGGIRVGELDEEMVFESRPGEVFLLGASSWRILDITHDRVLVTPAPGEPGRMPFWRGEGPGRSLAFGRVIGRLARRLVNQARPAARQELVDQAGLAAPAAEALLDYLHDQVDSTGALPSDDTVVVERTLDEIGDWRVLILSPFGARVHAPWAITIAARLRAMTLGEVDVTWGDDGIVLRLPESDAPPDLDVLLPAAEEVETELTQALAGTALFASRFRENAARALLLPRRHPGRRQPLWVQRRRAADLLAVASRFERFPLILETYREVLCDVFDLEGLREVLLCMRDRRIAVRVADTRQASPYACALLFGYAANFLYEGDAPLAERRAQMLALDPVQLRELIGSAPLRQLLDAEVVAQLAAELAGTTEAQRARRRSADDIHDWLLAVGDQNRAEIAAAMAPDIASSGALDHLIGDLVLARRILPVRVAGEERHIAIEDVGRYRDALGLVPPMGVAAAFLESLPEPLTDLVARYARTHGPFTLEDMARRFGMGVASLRPSLQVLIDRGLVLEGEFLPGGQGREWCGVEVLRKLRARSLARLRREVEPVEAAALARFLPEWQGLNRLRRGLDGLLDVVEQLSGAPLLMSVLERDILPARVHGYRPEMLDSLTSSGEVIWQGVEALGADDGRIALYPRHLFFTLGRPPLHLEGELPGRILACLARRGAIFFKDLENELQTFPADILATLWRLVFAGWVTNDSLAPLRALARGSLAKARRPARNGPERGRRLFGPPGSEGRWCLLDRERDTPTACATALALQLIARHGVLTREAVAAEGIPGGYAGLYPVLKSLEEAGRLRRGYFVSGLGAAQFADPIAPDRLRAVPDPNAEPLSILAATDPANPWGAALRWPGSGRSERLLAEARDASVEPLDNEAAAEPRESELPPREASPRGAGVRPQRSAGARVALWWGQPLAFLPRGGKHIVLLELDDMSQADRAHMALLKRLIALAPAGQGVQLTRVDGGEPWASALGPALSRSGFRRVRDGALWQPPVDPTARPIIPGMRRRPPRLPVRRLDDEPQEG